MCDTSHASYNATIPGFVRSWRSAGVANRTAPPPSLSGGRSDPLLRLLRRTNQHLADERLRLLGYEHRHGMSHVIRLQHFAGLFTVAARAEVGGHRAGRDDTDTDILAAKFLGDSVGEPIDGPFGGGVSRATGQGISSGKRGDVD